jgi:CRISPR-associated endonuclease/helicase Cas3
VLLRSFLALRDLGAVSVPADVEALIEAVYSGGSLALPPGDAWPRALAAAQKQLQEKERAHRAAARTYLIPGPVDAEEILQERNLQLDDDDPEKAEKLRAVTRLAEPTVALVVLYEINGALYLDPQARQRAHVSHAPDLGQVKALLRNAVTVQQAACVWHYLKQAPPPAWQKSGLLRYHRAVRVGPNGKSLSGEFPLLVDPDLGLVL